MPSHPYGINPTEKVMLDAIVKTDTLMKEVPETTCCNKTECCQAGCPNMRYCEFLNITRGHVLKLEGKELIDLHASCVRNYLWDQKKKKPCVFLKQIPKDGDNGGSTCGGCSIYPLRHLHCRLYGVVPQWTYVRKTMEVAREMGVAPETLPLFEQCPFVKIKPAWQEKFPNNRIPEGTIKKWEKKLREFDRDLGMPRDKEDEGFGFLTYHDWHLLFWFGTEMMEKLTVMRAKDSDEKKEQFISTLKELWGKGIQAATAE